MLSNFTLQRIPNDPNLQAWNAADELLLERLPTTPLGTVLIVNDTFGALAVALAPQQPWWWSDSAMALEALYANLEANVEPRHGNTARVFEPFNHGEPLNTVIFHLPKSLRLMAYQLSAILPKLADNAQVFALGMVKHISQGHIELMNRCFNQVNPGRAVKKARVIALSSPASTTLDVQPTRYTVPELSMSFANHPGCFAERVIDPGARAFLPFFQQFKVADRGLDLGCGNGLLSAALAQRFEEMVIDGVDESQQAILSAQQNLKHVSDRVSLVHSNSDHQLPIHQRYCLIVCNPPFHQNHTVTEGIAQTLFETAAERLTHEGEFWVVANRHLPYFYVLKTLFKQVDTHNAGAKFCVYQCKKT